MIWIKYEENSYNWDCGFIGFHTAKKLLSLDFKPLTSIEECVKKFADWYNEFYGDVKRW